MASANSTQLYIRPLKSTGLLQDNSAHIGAVKIDGLECLTVLGSRVPEFREGQITDWGHIQRAVYELSYIIKIFPAEVYDRGKDSKGRGLPL